METVMEGGRQASQSSAAMLCAIFHPVVTAVPQLLMSYALHYCPALKTGLTSVVSVLACYNAE